MNEAVFQELYLQKQDAGQIWPTGHSLPSPDLKPQPFICLTVLWVDNFDEDPLCIFPGLG